MGFVSKSSLAAVLALGAAALTAAPAEAQKKKKEEVFYLF